MSKLLRFPGSGNPTTPAPDNPPRPSRREQHVDTELFTDVRAALRAESAIEFIDALSMHGKPQLARELIGFLLSEVRRLKRENAALIRPVGNLTLREREG